MAPATALLLLLLRACFIVVRQVSLSWILYTARIVKWPWPWPWPWLKHSLGQQESLCQVWSWSARPFGRPLATYGHIAFYYVDLFYTRKVCKCWSFTVDCDAVVEEQIPPSESYIGPQLPMTTYQQWLLSDYSGQSPLFRITVVTCPCFTLIKHVSIKPFKKPSTTYRDNKLSLSLHVPVSFSMAVALIKIHRVRKKRVWSISGVTSSNHVRFSKFFHCNNLLKICNKAIIKYFTTP